MLIRVEIGIDAPGIDALLRRSFARDDEAQLVHDLREDGLITLGLVATDDEGQVVGYVAFSPVTVQGEELQWVGMAPLAVDEHYRGQGLARPAGLRRAGLAQRIWLCRRGDAGRCYVLWPFRLRTGSALRSPLPLAGNGIRLPGAPSGG